MDLQEWLNNPEVQAWLMPGIAVFVGSALFVAIVKQIKRRNRKNSAIVNESIIVKETNQKQTEEIRQRIISNLKTQVLLLKLYPVILGNTPEDTTLEGRTRAQCLDLIMDDFPRDLRSQGIRMAEFVHRLSDNLFHAYGKDANTTSILIDAQAVILDVECAAHVGLMYNELIANALQYGIDPGAKMKVNIILKERDNKLFISVGDNGIGMKVPYEPKFSFGLQLVNSLVHKYKGKLIINSRPGTRVEIQLTDYQKAEREVFVTPTQRLH